MVCVALGVLLLISFGTGLASCCTTIPRFDVKLTSSTVVGNFHASLISFLRYRWNFCTKSLSKVVNSASEICDFILDRRTTLVPSNGCSVAHLGTDNMIFYPQQEERTCNRLLLLLNEWVHLNLRSIN